MSHVSSTNVKLQLHNNMKFLETFTTEIPGNFEKTRNLKLLTSWNSKLTRDLAGG
jgi:hypothetical protein